MKFIYGQEQYFIDKEISSIINSYKIETHIYDEEVDVAKIIRDILTIGMFTKNKNIIIKNHPILKKEKIGDKLIEILKTIDQTITISFALTTDKLNNNITLIKYLLKNAECKEFNKISKKQIIPTIKDIVTSKGGTISNSATIKFSIKVPHDLRIIIKELDKLLLESNEITSEMIDISIGDYLKHDYFALSNALSASDAHSIWSAYKERKINGDEPTIIIGQIASLLNLAIIVDAYKKQGLSSQDISNIIKIHPFRIKKSLELIAKSSIENISNLAIDLANLDKNIKIGVMDKNKGLDYFLLKLIQFKIN